MQVNAGAAFLGWLEAHKRLVLILFGLILLFAVFIPAGLTLFKRFPASYVWTELMINYQGGLVRRGLLGEAAFRLNGFVPASRFLAAVMLGLYLAVGAWIVLRVGRFPEFATVLFLISPATLLFPIYDFEAFGRKDIVALAAFVLSVLVIERLSRNAAVLVIVVVVLRCGSDCRGCLVLFSTCDLDAHHQAPRRHLDVVAGHRLGGGSCMYGGLLCVDVAHQRAGSAGATSSQPGRQFTRTLSASPFTRER